MPRTLDPERAQAMAQTRARRALRTHVNLALARLDRGADWATAADLPARQLTRLVRLRAELEAVLQTLPTE